MTEQAELRALLEQVVNAEGSSRELDAQIHEVLIGPVEVDHDGDRLLLTPRGSFAELEHYTASLDAAFALKRQMLPGWEVTLQEHKEPDEYGQEGDWRSSASVNPVGDEGWVFEEEHGTPALALVAAVLMVLVKQESE